MTQTIGTAPRLAWRTMLLALVATGARGAPTDRKPPTRPTNLRVTAVGPYSVSLAWTPSTDNVGVARYVVCCSSERQEPGHSRAGLRRCLHRGRGAEPIADRAHLRGRRRQQLVAAEQLRDRHHDRGHDPSDDSGSSP